jgi:hypothetical protein
LLDAATVQLERRPEQTRDESSDEARFNAYRAAGTGEAVYKTA